MALTTDGHDSPGREGWGEEEGREGGIWGEEERREGGEKWEELSCMTNDKSAIWPISLIAQIS